MQALHRLLVRSCARLELAGLEVAFARHLAHDRRDRARSAEHR